MTRTRKVGDTGWTAYGEPGDWIVVNPLATMAVTAVALDPDGRTLGMEVRRKGGRKVLGIAKNLPDVVKIAQEATP